MGQVRYRKGSVDHWCGECALPGCTFSSPVDGDKNSADPFVDGTSAGGNIGGFIAEGPDGEQRLVFCLDAVTPTTNTAGGVVQMNVSGSLKYLLWKYSEYDGTLPANTALRCSHLCGCMARRSEPF